MTIYHELFTTRNFNNFMSVVLKKNMCLQRLYYTFFELNKPFKFSSIKLFEIDKPVFKKRFVKQIISTPTFFKNLSCFVHNSHA